MLQGLESMDSKRFRFCFMARDEGRKRWSKKHESVMLVGLRGFKSESG